MDGKSLIIILIMVSFSASAEVYKCADGQYQADPCDDQSEPLDLSNVGSFVTSSSVSSDYMNSVSDSAANPTNIKPHDKKQEFALYLHKQEIQRKIKDLEKDKKKAFTNSNNKVAQLRKQGNRANNNLAGATWQQSLAQEMTAVIQQGSTEIESIDRQISALRSELKQL
jgi:hypothetical protein